MWVSNGERGQENQIIIEECNAGEEDQIIIRCRELDEATLKLIKKARKIKNLISPAFCFLYAHSSMVFLIDF